MKINTAIFPLDGEWQICKDPDNMGIQNKWYENPPEECIGAVVPGIIQDSFIEYHGLAWYYKSFSPGNNPHKNGRHILRFHEVDFAAEIWLNGQKAGSHEGLEEIFTIDVTDIIIPNQSNLLAIRVLSPANEPIDGMVLNELAVGRRRYPEPVDNAYATGGIIGSVELLLTPEIYIGDIYAIPDWESGEIKVETSLVLTASELKNKRIILKISGASAVGGITLDEITEEHDIEESSVIKASISIPNYRLWQLNDPYLYRVTVRAEIKGGESFDERSVRCGFRDFRYENGYFRFNGKRIRIKGALYTALCFPSAQSIPHDEDLLRRDVLNMKAFGFNAVRIHSGSTLPRQLDVWDEMGILVLEESFGAGWPSDSSRIGADWERSMTRLIKRDRNHPSIVMWSLLNEQFDTRLFRHAVQSLPIIRNLDQTRLILLNSGRFDKDETIGNICNPYEQAWGGNLQDIHIYVSFPHSAENMGVMRAETPDLNFLWSMYPKKETGELNPILLSEHGVCGAEDLPHIIKNFEMINKTHAGDARLYKRKYEQFRKEWERLKLYQCWARPEDYFKDSHKNLAKLIYDDYNAWLASPAIIGSFCSTQIVDAWFHGCGVTTPFRKIKPGMSEVYSDVMSPLRFSLFPEPITAYRNTAINLEAVLISEDALKQGIYPVRFQVFDPLLNQIMDERIDIEIAGTEPMFSRRVFAKEILIGGTPGTYKFTADFECGAEAGGGNSEFYILDKAEMPEINKKIILWGTDCELASWLTANNIAWQKSENADSDIKHVILVSGEIKENFDELNKFIEKGSPVIYLTPETLPKQIEKFGKSEPIPSWYFRCDHWAKRHDLFVGLPCGGIMDYGFYRNILGSSVITGHSESFEFDAVCGGLQMSGANSVYFESGTMLSVHKQQNGLVILNTLRIRENLGKDPVAEVLLRNMIQYGLKNI